MEHHTTVEKKNINEPPQEVDGDVVASLIDSPTIKEGNTTTLTSTSESPHRLYNLAKIEDETSYIGPASCPEVSSIPPAVTQDNQPFFLSVNKINFSDIVINDRPTVRYFSVQGAQFKLGKTSDRKSETSIEISFTPSLRCVYILLADDEKRLSLEGLTHDNIKEALITSLTLKSYETVNLAAVILPDPQVLTVTSSSSLDTFNGAILMETVRSKNEPPFVLKMPFYSKAALSKLEVETPFSLSYITNDGILSRMRRGVKRKGEGSSSYINDSNCEIGESIINESHRASIQNSLHGSKETNGSLENEDEDEYHDVWDKTYNHLEESSHFPNNRSASPRLDFYVYCGGDSSGNGGHSMEFTVTNRSPVSLIFDIQLLNNPVELFKATLNESDKPNESSLLGKKIAPLKPHEIKKYVLTIVAAHDAPAQVCPSCLVFKNLKDPTNLVNVPVSVSIEREEQGDSQSMEQWERSFNMLGDDDAPAFSESKLSHYKTGSRKDRSEESNVGLGKESVNSVEKRSSMKNLVQSRCEGERLVSVSNFTSTTGLNNNSASKAPLVENMIDLGAVYYRNNEELNSTIRGMTLSSPSNDDDPITYSHCVSQIETEITNVHPTSPVCVTFKGGPSQRHGSICIEIMGEDIETQFHQNNEGEAQEMKDLLSHYAPDVSLSHIVSFTKVNSSVLNNAAIAIPVKKNVTFRIWFFSAEAPPQQHTNVQGHAPSPFLSSSFTFTIDILCSIAPEAASFTGVESKAIRRKAIRFFEDIHTLFTDFEESMKIQERLEFKGRVTLSKLKMHTTNAKVVSSVMNGLVNEITTIETSGSSSLAEAAQKTDIEFGKCIMGQPKELPCFHITNQSSLPAVICLLFNSKIMMVSQCLLVAPSQSAMCQSAKSSSPCSSSKEPSSIINNNAVHQRQWSVKGKIDILRLMDSPGATEGVSANRIPHQNTRHLSKRFGGQFVYNLLIIPPYSTVFLFLTLEPLRVNENYQKQITVLNISNGAFRPLSPSVPFLEELMRRYAASPEDANLESVLIGACKAICCLKVCSHSFYNIKSRNMAPKEARQHDTLYSFTPIGHYKHPKVLLRVPYVMMYALKNKSSKEYLTLQLSTTSPEISVVGLNVDETVKQHISEKSSVEYKRQDSEMPLTSTQATVAPHVLSGENDSTSDATSEASMKEQKERIQAAHNKLQYLSSILAKVSNYDTPLLSLLESGGESSPKNEPRSKKRNRSNSEDEGVMSDEKDSTSISSSSKSSSYVNSASDKDDSDDNANSQIERVQREVTQQRAGSNERCESNDSSTVSNRQQKSGKKRDTSVKPIDNSSQDNSNNYSKPLPQVTQLDEETLLPKDISLDKVLQTKEDLLEFIRTETTPLSSITVSPQQVKFIYIIFIRRTSSYSATWTSKEDSMSIQAPGIELPRIIRLSYCLGATTIQVVQKSKSFGDVAVGDRKSVKIALENKCASPAWFMIEKPASLTTIKIGNRALGSVWHSDVIKGFRTKEVEVTIFFGIRGSLKETLTVTNLLDGSNTFNITLKAEVKKANLFEINPMEAALKLSMKAQLMHDFCDRDETQVTSAGGSAYGKISLSLTNTSKTKRDFRLKMSEPLNKILGTSLVTHSTMLSVLAQLKDTVPLFAAAAIEHDYEEIAKAVAACIQTDLRISVELVEQKGSTSKIVEERIEKLQQKLKIYIRKGKKEKAAIATLEIEKFQRVLNGDQDEHDEITAEDVISATSCDISESESESMRGSETLSNRTDASSSSNYGNRPPREHSSFSHEELAEKLIKEGVELPTIASMDQMKIILHIRCTLMSGPLCHLFDDRMAPFVYNTIINGLARMSNDGALPSKTAILTFFEAKDKESCRKVPLKVTLQLCASTVVPSSLSAITQNKSLVYSRQHDRTLSPNYQVASVPISGGISSLLLPVGSLKSYSSTMASLVDKSIRIIICAASMKDFGMGKLTYFGNIPMIVVHECTVETRMVVKVALSALSVDFPNSKCETTAVFLKPMRVGGDLPQFPNAKIRCNPPSCTVNSDIPTELALEIIPKIVGPQRYLIPVQNKKNPNDNTYIGIEFTAKEADLVDVEVDTIIDFGVSLIPLSVEESINTMSHELITDAQHACSDSKFPHNIKSFLVKNKSKDASLEITIRSNLPSQLSISTDPSFRSCLFGHIITLEADGYCRIFVKFTPKMPPICSLFSFSLQEEKQWLQWREKIVAETMSMSEKAHRPSSLALPPNEQIFRSNTDIIRGGITIEVVGLHMLNQPPLHTRNVLFSKTIPFRSKVGCGICIVTKVGASTVSIEDQRLQVLESCFRFFSHAILAKNSKVNDSQKSYITERLPYVAMPRILLGTIVGDTAETSFTIHNPSIENTITCQIQSLGCLKLLHDEHSHLSSSTKNNVAQSDIPERTTDNVSTSVSKSIYTQEALQIILAPGDSHTIGVMVEFHQTDLIHDEIIVTNTSCDQKPIHILVQWFHTKGPVTVELVQDTSMSHEKACNNPLTDVTLQESKPHLQLNHLRNNGDTFHFPEVSSLYLCSSEQCYLISKPMYITVLVTNRSTVELPLRPKTNLPIRFCQVNSDGLEIPIMDTFVLQPSETTRIRCILDEVTTNIFSISPTSNKCCSTCENLQVDPSFTKFSDLIGRLDDKETLDLARGGLNLQHDEMTCVSSDHVSEECLLISKAEMIATVCDHPLIAHLYDSGYLGWSDYSSSSSCDSSMVSSYVSTTTEGTQSDSLKHNEALNISVNSTVHSGDEGDDHYGVSGCNSAVNSTILSNSKYDVTNIPEAADHPQCAWYSHLEAAPNFLIRASGRCCSAVAQWRRDRAVAAIATHGTVEVFSSLKFEIPEELISIKNRPPLVGRCVAINRIFCKFSLAEAQLEQPIIDIGRIEAEATDDKRIKICIRNLSRVLPITLQWLPDAHMNITSTYYTSGEGANQVKLLPQPVGSDHLITILHNRLITIECILKLKKVLSGVDGPFSVSTVFLNTLNTENEICAKVCGRHFASLWKIRINDSELKMKDRHREIVQLPAIRVDPVKTSPSILTKNDSKKLSYPPTNNNSFTHDMTIVSPVGHQAPYFVHEDNPQSYSSDRMIVASGSIVSDWKMSIASWEGEARACLRVEMNPDIQHYLRMVVTKRESLEPINYHCLDIFDETVSIKGKVRLVLLPIRGTNTLQSTTHASEQLAIGEQSVSGVSTTSAVESMWLVKISRAFFGKKKLHKTDLQVESLKDAIERIKSSKTGPSPQCWVSTIHLTRLSSSDSRDPNDIPVLSKSCLTVENCDGSIGPFVEGEIKGKVAESGKISGAPENTQPQNEVGEEIQMYASLKPFETFSLSGGKLRPSIKDDKTVIYKENITVSNIAYCHTVRLACSILCTSRASTVATVSLQLKRPPSDRNSNQQSAVPADDTGNIGSLRQQSNLASTEPLLHSSGLSNIRILSGESVVIIVRVEAVVGTEATLKDAIGLVFEDEGVSCSVQPLELTLAREKAIDDDDTEPSVGIYDKTTFDQESSCGSDSVNTPLAAKRPRDKAKSPDPYNYISSIHLSNRQPMNDSTAGIGVASLSIEGCTPAPLDDEETGTNGGGMFKGSNYILQGSTYLQGLGEVFSGSTGTTGKLSNPIVQFKVKNLQLESNEYSCTITGMYPKTWIQIITEAGPETGEENTLESSITTIGSQRRQPKTTDSNRVTRKIKGSDVHTVSFFVITPEVGFFEADIAIVSVPVSSERTSYGEVHFVRIHFKVVPVLVPIQICDTSIRGQRRMQSLRIAQHLFQVFCPSRGGGKRAEVGLDGTTVPLRLRTFVGPLVIENKYFEIHNSSAMPLEFILVANEQYDVHPADLASSVKCKLSIFDKAESVNISNITVDPKSTRRIPLVLTVTDTSLKPGSKVGVKMTLSVRCMVVVDILFHVKIIFRIIPRSFQLSMTRIQYERQDIGKMMVEPLNMQPLQITHDDLKMTLTDEGSHNVSLSTPICQVMYPPTSITIKNLGKDVAHYIIMVESGIFNFSPSDLEIQGFGELTVKVNVDPDALHKLLWTIAGYDTDTDGNREDNETDCDDRDADKSPSAGMHKTRPYPIVTIVKRAFIYNKKEPREKQLITISMTPPNSSNTIINEKFCVSLESDATDTPLSDRILRPQQSQAQNIKQYEIPKLVFFRERLEGRVRSILRRFMPIFMARETFHLEALEKTAKWYEMYTESLRSKSDAEEPSKIQLDERASEMEKLGNELDNMKFPSEEALTLEVCFFTDDIFYLMHSKTLARYLTGDSFRGIRGRDDEIDHTHSDPSDTGTAEASAYFRTIVQKQCYHQRRLFVMLAQMLAAVLNTESNPQIGIFVLNGLWECPKGPAPWIKQLAICSERLNEMIEHLQRTI